MSEAARYEDSDELLNIYIALRKLKCLPQEDHSLFPQAFLWKLLNERLTGLSELASEICLDLFGLVRDGIRTVDVRRQQHQQQQPVQASPDALDGVKSDIRPSEPNEKFFEFDEYFHTCLFQVYDLILDLHWHDPLPAEGAPADIKLMSHMDKFLAFRQSLVQALTRAKGKRRLSPKLERRVQFMNLPPLVDSHSPGQQAAAFGRTANRRRAPVSDRRNLLGNHSVFALELLLFAVEMFVQRLIESLAAWSTELQSDLNRQINFLFESNVKIKSKQLMGTTKAIKVYNNVHLTILDLLTVIKRDYLIEKVSRTLLARDSHTLRENYKQPRIACYVQRLHSEVEAKLLRDLVRQSLQILFNLIVCEINVPPVELRSGTKANPKKGANAPEDIPRQQRRQQQQQLERTEHNVLNFIGNWLKLDDILFGPPSVPQQQQQQSPPPPSPQQQTPQPGPDAPEKEERAHEDPAGGLARRRPPLLASRQQGSTLSLSNEDIFKSSSRILTQIDNLGEFTRQLLQTIANRLSQAQQLAYFFDCISSGMNAFFDTIAVKLEQQLRSAVAARAAASTSGPSNGGAPGAASGPPNPLPRDKVATDNGAQRERDKQLAPESSIDLMVAKIRCLKFAHIIGSVAKILADEVARVRVDTDEQLPRLEEKLAAFSQKLK